MVVGVVAVSDFLHEKNYDTLLKPIKNECRFQKGIVILLWRNLSTWIDNRYKNHDTLLKSAFMIFCRNNLDVKLSSQQDWKDSQSSRLYELPMDSNVLFEKRHD